MEIDQFEQISLQIGIVGLIVYMGFIVYDLARKTRAGKWGGTVLFIVLFLGVLGFIIKTIVYYVYR